MSRLVRVTTNMNGCEKGTLYSAAGRTSHIISSKPLITDATCISPRVARISCGRACVVPKREKNEIRRDDEEKRKHDRGSEGAASWKHVHVHIRILLGDAAFHRYLTAHAYDVAVALLSKGARVKGGRQGSGRSCGECSRKAIY